jgi:hypothetical protein
MPVLRALFADGGISPVLEHGGKQPQAPYFSLPAVEGGGQGKIKYMGCSLNPT